MTPATLPQPSPRPALGVSGGKPGLTLPAVVALHGLLLLALLKTPALRPTVLPATPVMAMLVGLGTPSTPAEPALPPMAPPPPRPAMAPLPLPPLTPAAAAEAATPMALGQPAVAAAPAPAAPATPAALPLPGPAAALPAPPRAEPSPTPATPPTPPPAAARKSVAASAVQYQVLPPVELPRAARRAGESGVVWLRVVVDTRGLPVQVQLQRSSGYARLDEQALWAMRQARFRPHTENGTPVEIEVLAPIEYPLEAMP